MTVQYRIRYRSYDNGYRTLYRIRYSTQGGLLPALDRDAADVITGSEHIVKAYADKHSAAACDKQAAADSRPDSGTGSRLFEVNMWMWRYGRTFPRQISVEQAVELRKKRVHESRARGAETLRRRHVQAWEKRAAAPQ